MQIKYGDKYRVKRKTEYFFIIINNKYIHK